MNPHLIDNSEPDTLPWYKAGPCYGMTHEAEWFPTPRTPLIAIQNAYTICSECPLWVKRECRAAGESEGGWGIWGGKNLQPQIEQNIRQAARRGRAAMDADRRQKRAYDQARYQAQLARKAAAEAESRLADLEAAWEEHRAEIEAEVERRGN